MLGAFILLNLLLAVVVSKFAQCQGEIELLQDETRIKALGDFALPVLKQTQIRRLWRLEAASEGDENDARFRDRRRAKARHDIVYASQIARNTLQNNDSEPSQTSARSAIREKVTGVFRNRDKDMMIVNIATLHPAAVLKRDALDDERDLIDLSQIATYLESDYLEDGQHIISSNNNESCEDGNTSQGDVNGETSSNLSSSESDEMDDKIDMERERMARNIIEWISFLIVSNKAFDIIIYFMILGNTLALALEFHGSPDLLNVILKWANMVFTYVFTLEMLLKAAAYVVLHSFLSLSLSHKEYNIDT